MSGELEISGDADGFFTHSFQLEMSGDIELSGDADGFFTNNLQAEMSGEIELSGDADVIKTGLINIETSGSLLAAGEAVVGSALLIDGISTQTGGTASSVPTGTQFAVVWDNPSYALIDDGNSSTVDFSSSVGVSEYLKISNFLMYLPDDVIEITGIKVQVKRSALGEVTDSVIGLTYFDGFANQIVTDSKEDNQFWSSSQEVVFYGDSNDNWGRTWTIEEINNSNFGFVIAAYGDPILNSVGRIQSVTISVYCTQSTTDYASGGIVCLGQATKTSTYSSDVPSGGAVLGGLVLNILDEIITTGGAVCAGEAELSSGVAVFGGSSVGGTAEVYEICNVILTANDYELVLSGNKVVPPDLSHGFRVVARITLTATGNLSWKISHPFANVGRVVLLGPADKNTSVLWEGNDDINIANYGTTSPMTGSIFVSRTQGTNIRNGLYYLQFESAAPRRKLRAQVVRENINLSGEARVEVPLTSGGSVSSGSAQVFVKVREQTNGGAFIGGSADQSLLLFATGGIGGAGSAVCVQTCNIAISSAGIKTTATSLIDLHYNISTTQSILLGGFGIIGIQPYISGGSVSSGESPYLYSYKPTPTGGSSVSGSYILQQTYAAQDVKGSGRLGGRARKERIRPLVFRNISVANALATPNILNTPPVDNNKIIDKFASTVPELDPNGFRIQHEPGWCEFSQPCGAPLVPDIVKKRQGKYMPSKQGKNVMSRQIATLTQSE